MLHASLMLTFTMIVLVCPRSPPNKVGGLMRDRLWVKSSQANHDCTWGYLFCSARRVSLTSFMSQVLNQVRSPGSSNRNPFTSPADSGSFVTGLGCFLTGSRRCFVTGFGVILMLGSETLCYVFPTLLTPGRFGAHEQLL